MTGYVRTDTVNNIADGNVISAADLDGEFNGVQAAFNSSTGHTHDGTSAEGAPITKLGPVQDVTISTTVLGVKTTNTVDLGTSSLKFKDFYLAGNASIGGTLGVTGATTLSAALTYGGVTLSNAVTGTGNMVLSAGPTLTGTAGFVNITASGTLNVTGIATLTAQPILSSLTASQAVFTDASKGLVSNAITGTGSVVMSASPTLTGTITAAAANFSGAVALNGNATIGDADTDTITQAASYVTGTQLKSAKTDTNTLSLAAYDVDGTAYTNLITLTAGNTPTLALTSTGVGTINNMSIGATTASTGAFTTLSASSTVTLSGGTANGVGYLDGSKVLTTGSALTFSGSNLSVVGTYDINQTNLFEINNGQSGATKFASGVSLTSDSGGNYTSAFYVVSGSNTRYNLISGSPTDVLFYSGNTEGFRLTSTSLYTASTINVGIGTSSPGSFAAAGRNLVVGTGTGNNGLTIYSGNASGSNIYFADGTTGAETYAGFIQYAHSTNAMLFGVNNTGSEAMTLDASGNLGVGTTSPATKLHISTDGTYDPLRLQSTQSGFERSWTLGPNVGANGFFVIRDSTAGQNRVAIDTSGNLLVGTTGLGTIGSSSGFQITPSGAMYSASTGDSVFSRRSANGTVITFRRDTTTVGSIDVTTTATSYVTSSDYRLKNTIAPMTGALAKVAALKPVTYKWNVDGSDGEGFIAHELAEVVPQCVTGEKDAVDADGNPKYQGIDTSFLVATLTAAIQEQQALITQLTDRITALESA